MKASKDQNLQIWNDRKNIDPNFTKPISGRDYTGTSPDPQEIIRMLTEEFGPAGRGFGWSVIQEDFTPLGSETVLHWCRIDFWWKRDGEKNSFQQYGQTKAAYVAGRKNGSGGYLKIDEDAPKKSLTDAITKAASQLGFAASIYLGLYDDAKYVNGLIAEGRWRDMFEDDSRFWDPVFDSLPEEPNPEDVAEKGAEFIKEKALSYKKHESVTRYMQSRKDAVAFIEQHIPDHWENIKSDILQHFNTLKEAA